MEKRRARGAAPAGQPKTAPRRTLDLEQIDWFESIPYLLLHVAAVAMPFWTGVSPTAIAVCVALYGIRMFGITAGYHRYLAHQSFKTSRWFQFVLALIGCTSVQKGPLWWAANHRHHHAHSDDPEDIHSPVQDGFWWSHTGWFLSHRYDNTPWRLITGLSRYPELRWLNQYHVVPGIALAIALYIAGAVVQRKAPALGVTGWQLVAWGFMVSTVLLYHGTFVINSLAHVWGTRRYNTKDDSRNNFFLAIITLGEGWHNNHHFAPSSERQGFYWWEIDISHYILRVLSWFGIVWDLQGPPARAFAPQPPPHN